MFLIYIDESGKHYFTDPENFILSSLIINECDWQEIDNRVTDIKIHHFPAIEPENVEFHTTAMMHHEGIYRNLNWNEIYSVLDDCYNLISQISCALISVVIQKNNVYPGIRDRWDGEYWAYKLLLERLCKYLGKTNDQMILLQIPSQYGILLIDSINPDADRKLRKKVKHFMKFGSDYSINRYLIEDPLFVSSQYRALSQLIDLVAFCVRRANRTNTGNTMGVAQFQRYYSLISTKFDTNADGEIEGCGIKHFPP